MQSMSQQPLVGEECYVMTLLTAAKETICNAVECSLMELANEERLFGSVAIYVTCTRIQHNIIIFGILSCNVCQLVEESVSSIQVTLCRFINEKRSFIPFSIDFRVVTGVFFSPLQYGGTWLCFQATTGGSSWMSSDIHPPHCDSVVNGLS